MSGALDSSSQAPKRVSDQSLSADHTASSTTSMRITRKRGSPVSLVNIVSGLIYFDLVEPELSTSSMNEEMVFLNFIQNTPILNFSRPTVLTAQLHRRMGPEGGAGSEVKI